ncbi:MAG: nucleotidyl transferase AbiEii/AbiGii toxin family protein, partial [Clostridia bacterium]|nr:nucleotidyl transferase AbiEii/AbiGii toxin family protein [Clostridia bacterium]
MNRFSEDIDLTVKMIETESNTSNKNRLKKSALSYEIDGLKLMKEETIDNKGSVTAFYKYESAFNIDDVPLHRAGKIQIESTSFTVSEPTATYVIEPLLYKLSTDNEKEILEKNFDIKNFEIEIIKLERMFIDKIFALEFYLIRKMYMDAAKHLYDIYFLSKRAEIQSLLKDTKELEKLIEYKRKEETVRKGGIDSNLKIKDFSYFNLNFDEQFIN